MQKYSWKEIQNRHYYYKTEDGKIVGFVHKYGNHDTWSTVVYSSDMIYSNNSEKSIGQYIDFDSAKKAIATFWLIQDATLIEN